MNSFPSPWDQDEHLFTRWPGPVTVRYRSVVCRARGISAPAFGPGVVVSRCWRAEEPDLAEEHGLPRETEPTNPWSELMRQEIERNPVLFKVFDDYILLRSPPAERDRTIQWSSVQDPGSFTP